MKKGIFKKIVLSLMSFVAAVCVSLGVVSVVAKAASKVTIADEADFRAVQGASVLLKTSENGGKDTNGLRFVFEMSKEKFAEIAITDENGQVLQYKDGVKTGVYVVPTSKTAGKTGANVTTDDILNSSSKAMQWLDSSQWEYDAKKDCYYSCAYLYNYPKSAYKAELSTCAFYETSEGRVYTAVSTRSISYVASKAIGSGKYDAKSVSILHNYIPSAQEILFSMDDPYIDFGKLGVSIDANTELSIDTKKVEFTLNGQVATITGEKKLADNGALSESEKILTAKPQSATGEVKILRITNGTSAHQIPLKVCTDVIYTAEEFNEMQKFIEDVQSGLNTPVSAAITAKYKNNANYANSKKIEGYYALGADIDFSTAYPNGYRSPFDHWSMGGNATDVYNHGWKATFDGQGHRITNLKLLNTPVFESGDYATYSMSASGVSEDPYTRYTSLFGAIAGKNGEEPAGTIKDVSFGKCSIGSGLVESAFLASKSFGVIENVIIDLSMPTTNTANSGNAAFVGAENNLSHASYSIGAKISDVTVIVRTALGSADCVIRKVGNSEDQIVDSVLVVNVPENRIYEGYSTLDSIRQATNGNLKAHFDIIERRGQTQYSLDDGKIDFGKLEIAVNANDTRIISLGKSVEYGLENQVATIADDEVLKAQPQTARGQEEKVLVITPTETYEVSLQMCSDIIYSATEFDEMKRFLEDTKKTAASGSPTEYAQVIYGYYVLGADISFAEAYPDGYDSPFSFTNTGRAWDKDSAGEWNGWQGTFDGNGYTISDLKIVGSKISTNTVWSASLFGTIGDKGIVRNVAFLNGSMASNLRSSGFFANMVMGTVSDIFIEVDMDTVNTGDGKDTEGNSPFATAANDRGLQIAFNGNDIITDVKNVTIVTNFSSGTSQYDYVMKGSTGTDYATERPIRETITGPFVSIGLPESRIHNQRTDYSVLKKLNGNIVGYRTVEEAANDSKLRGYGNVRFIYEGKDLEKGEGLQGWYSVVWNGRVIKRWLMNDTVETIKFSNDTSVKMNSDLTETPYTYEATFKITGTQAQTSPGGYSMIVDNHSAPFEGQIISLRIRTNGRLVLYLMQGSSQNYWIEFNKNLATGEKLHVAVTVEASGTTYTYRLYVNGILEETLTKTHADGINKTKKVIRELYIGGCSPEHCAKGCAFSGELYSVAMWKDTRTAEEIYNDCTLLDYEDSNLMVAYDLTGNFGDLGENVTGNMNGCKDLSKNRNDLLIESNWIWSTSSPYNPKDYEYSFMVVGDTQIVSKWSIVDTAKGIVSKGNTYLDKMYDYIVDNVEAKKVKHVIGLGDITEFNSRNEWEESVRVTSKMNGVVSYSMIPGNHDGSTNWFANSVLMKDGKPTSLEPYFYYDTTTDGTVTTASGTEDITRCNKYFNEFYGSNSSYAKQSSVIASKEGVYGLNTIHEFSGNASTKYLVVALEYGPTKAILDWASGIISQSKYAKHNVIVTTHGYIWANGSYLVRGDTTNSGMIPTAGQNGSSAYCGDEMWNYFVTKHANITMVICGHVNNDTIFWQQKTASTGQVITEMLCDPSGIGNKAGTQPLVQKYGDTMGNRLVGMVATYYVKADGTIDVEWYSTIQKAYYLRNGQFSFKPTTIKYA